MIRGEDVLAAAVLWGSLLGVALIGLAIERWWRRRSVVVVADYGRFRATLEDLEARRDEIRMRSLRPLPRSRR